MCKAYAADVKKALRPRGIVPTAAFPACQYVRKFPAYAALPCPARQLRSIAPHAGVTEYRAAQEGKILLIKFCLHFRLPCVTIQELESL